MIIEPGYTSHLQVMDVVVNRAVKEAYKSAFRKYCVNEIKSHMDKGGTAASAQLNISMSLKS